MNLLERYFLPDSYAKNVFSVDLNALRRRGIHLILCTQRASGIVDRQIESNIQSVVCFKVASKQDSYDVLGNNHAYQLDRAGQLICKCGNEEIYSQTVWLDQQPTIIFNDLNFNEQFRLFYKEQFISNKNTCIEQINEQTTKCSQLYIRYFELEKVPKDMFGIYDYYQKRKIISFSSSQIKWIIGGKIKGFEEKTVYLPQLLMSAQAAKEAFEAMGIKPIEKFVDKK